MVADPPFDPRRPFTRAEALAAGVTPWQLRGAGYARVYRNVYVSRDVPRTVELRARAGLRLAPRGTVVSHYTAAALWGGALTASSEIHVSIPVDETFRVDGIRTHRDRVVRASTTRGGVRLTTPEQTFVDLAAELDLVQLVVLGDGLVHRGHTTPARLVEASWRRSGSRHCLALRAANLVRDGVDSPPESRLRLLIVLSGLPEPTVNHILRDPGTGDWLRRFELAYPLLRIAVEYEGRHHRDDAEVWAADIDRREGLDRNAWRVVQVISSGLFDHPLRTLQRVDQARVDRGAVPVGTFWDEWRRYFPGKDVR